MDWKASDKPTIGIDPIGGGTLREMQISYFSNIQNSYICRKICTAMMKKYPDTKFYLETGHKGMIFHIWLHESVFRAGDFMMMLGTDFQQTINKCKVDYEE